MESSEIRRLRRALLAWYAVARRDLPWRRTSEPYRIWLSEVMLQQTRAAAAAPYYQRFLERFPNVEALAAAPEQDVLALWAGLGYYTRARLLHRAAQQVASLGRFPDDYDSIRALPGVGDYTAAAVASIAFAQPHAVLDGNVARLLSRLTAESGIISLPATRARLQATASLLLDPKAPGAFNQAMMELGATVCLPRVPLCNSCPLQASCSAYQTGRQAELPVKAPRKPFHSALRELLLIRRRGAILFRQLSPSSPRLAGFWELPERASLPDALRLRLLGSFPHTIVQTRYECQVWEATLPSAPAGLRWIDLRRFSEFPVSTISKKALKIAGI